MGLSRAYVEISGVLVNTTLNGNLAGEMQKSRDVRMY